MNPSEQLEPLLTRRGDELPWQSTAILVTVFACAAIWTLLVAHGSPRPPHLALATITCILLAAAAWRMDAVTPMAALTGALLSLALCLAKPPAAAWWRSPLLPLLALFALTHFATRFRRSRKEKAGLAEARRGRRASQVAANVGVAALVLPVMLLLAHGLPPVLPYLIPHVLAYLFFGVPLVAALAEAAADTVSSEMGQAMPGQPRMITTGRTVAAGTDGAISLAGTLAGSIAAASVVLVSAWALPLPPLAATIAFAAAIFGLLLDSLLGATAERKGWINNDAVNFFSTLGAAVLAGWLTYLASVA